MLEVYKKIQALCVSYFKFLNETVQNKRGREAGNLRNDFKS